jgi:hypothetical protein
MHSRESHETLSPVLRAALTVMLAMLAIFLAGCGSTTRETAPLDLQGAIDNLQRPLPGDPAALYRLRIPSSGGLRMALLTSGEAGRLTVSEPFGSAVSLTAWSKSIPPTFFDLREGCRLDSGDLELVLGIGAMPPPQALRLLAGRLPAVADDTIAVDQNDHIVVEGMGWAAEVAVVSDPWRVTSVQGVGARGAGWRFELSDHTLSVPGHIRVENADGRWAELELVRLEWNQGGDLPPLPDLRPCVFEPDS